jgi:phosphomannomutase
MSIFRAYDVRGVYPKELDEELAYKIGRAFVVFLKVKQVVVSQDMRVSSDSLKKELIKGIIDQGADVIEIAGLCSTPKHYFSTWFLKAPGSIMVTASHNPGQYNGFKFTKENAIAISGDNGIKVIEKLVLENKFIDSSTKGKIIKKDVTKEYQKHILKFIDPSKVKPLKVVIDAGNGMGGKELELALDKLPLDVVKMYFKPDGNFPNHEANPLLDENCIDIKKRIVEEKADFGIAPDGDADRVFFFDEKGERISGDFITALIAEKLLEKEKGKILYDLRSSWVTGEKIEEFGGKAVMCRVGHTFIKDQLRKEKAIFAGELSCHFYFRDNFNTDSGIVASLIIIELISQKNQKMSEIIKPFRKYFASGEINSSVVDKEGKMKELEKIYKGKVSHLDGIRIDFSDWWFNVRASNTEPLLRLNLEAKTKSKMEEKRDEVLKVIRG